MNFMFGGGLMMWLFWIGLVVLLWLLFKGIRGDDESRLSASELLERRLARGEITPEEYRQRKAMLEGKD